MPDEQKVIERHFHKNGDGLFGTFQHAIIIALALAIGSGLWTMNVRLTRVETLLETIIRDAK